MKLAFRTAALGAVIAATAVLVAPGTALADDPKDGGVARCSDGKVCLFDGPSLTGDVLQLDPVDNRNIGSAWNDRAGSVWNRSSLNVCIWTDADFRGLNWIIEPGNKQELWALYDNSVTSIEAHSGYGCGG
ncbi:peptidase inhibitor family I36 protein [Streptomyces sp. NPDC008125]|uniref:peptidase inhibitor family I36 protein n=1 Tax=Streptomyces sp. NPDC008125 TaxID=3364811 RepID=UPI0036E17F3A